MTTCYKKVLASNHKLIDDDVSHFVSHSRNDPS